MSTRSRSSRRAPAASAAGRALRDILALPALEGASITPEGGADGVTIGALVLDDPAAPQAEAGLLVAPRGIAKTVPAGVVAVITRVAISGNPTVPVIVIPADRPWGDVLSAIAQALSGEEREREARRVFRQALISGRGVPGIAEAASQLLDAPVALLDEYLDILGAAGISDAREDSLHEAIEAARGHGPASLLGPFVESGLQGTHILQLDGDGTMAGVLVAPLVFLDVNMMGPLLIKGFAGAVLGGLSSLTGVFLGGLSMGVIENLMGAYVSGSFSEALSFGLIIAVLVLRPEGVFGRIKKRKV